MRRDKITTALFLQSGRDSRENSRNKCINIVKEYFIEAVELSNRFIIDPSPIVLIKTSSAVKWRLLICAKKI